MNRVASLGCVHTIYSKKVAFCFYHRLQAAPEPGTGVFHLHNHRYVELPLYLGNQRVFGVLSLPVDKFYEVGPFLCGPHGMSTS